MGFLHIFDLCYNVNILNYIISHFSIVRLKIEYYPLLRQGVGIPSAEKKEYREIKLNKIKAKSPEREKIM